MSGTATARSWAARHEADGQLARLAFIAVMALLLAAGVALTLRSCAAMAAMGAMPMPGGWRMSPMWMRMPGGTWPGAAGSFLGMWVAMMLAMMLPSLAPALWFYGNSAGARGAARSGWLTALVGAGYFSVWTVLGMAVFPLGVTLTALEMRLPALARAVPLVAGALVVCAGAFQLTRRKAHHLACCRDMPARRLDRPLSASTAWRDGWRLGLHCSYASVGLTAILLVIGVMDVRVMAVVTAAATTERLAPSGERAARAIGVVILAAGLLVSAHAAGLG